MDVDLSSLPGLRSRAYRGTADHQAMAGLINRWSRAVDIDEVATVEELDHNYSHLEHCNPSEDMVLVETAGGTLVGYTRTEWSQVSDGERKYAVFAKVDPEWQDTALPVVLLRAGRDRAGAIAAGHDLTCPKVFEGWAEDTRERVLYDAYVALGFRAVTFEATMVRPHLDDVPDVALPEGVEVRPVDPSHLRAIWEADNEAFRDHWGYTEPSEEDWKKFLDFPHRDESLWKIAWEGDSVVGQVRSFINVSENEESGRLRGWTEFISTDRRRRKQGVATALICASLRELKARGMTEAALGVHTENPTGAFRLYESLGYEVRERYTTFQQPVG
ncbi:MAG: N-acetyltransferase family protein [Acidimicrobiia bacterium]